MVSITFAGEIQETYPARIMNVIRVAAAGGKFTLTYPEKYL